MDLLLMQELLCSICMETYLDPTTLRCGHSFCRSCIDKTWDNQEGEYTCPECRWSFHRRPELKLNVRLRNIAKHIYYWQTKQGETNMFCAYTPDPTVNVSCTHEERLVDNLPDEVDKQAEKASTKTANSPQKSKLPSLRKEAKDYDETMDYHLSGFIKEITEDHHQSYNVDKVTVHEMVGSGEKVNPQQQPRMGGQGKSCELCEKADVLLRKLKEKMEFTLETIQSDISKYKEKLSSHFLHFTLRHTTSPTEL